MWFARFPSHLSAPWVGAHGGTVWVAEDGSEACAYLQQAPSVPVLPEVVLVRLRPSLALPGEAQGRDAPWHYVVATDGLPAQEADFDAWYDTEHLPGLAAVPGVASAARYRVVEGSGPSHHAGYDLADRAAFNSPPWLAVRRTEWSSRVRPAFFNTRRTMYHRLP
jgi:hypothetical protein